MMMPTCWSLCWSQFSCRQPNFPLLPLDEREVNVTRFVNSVAADKTFISYLKLLRGWNICSEQNQVFCCVWHKKLSDANFNYVHLGVFLFCFFWLCWFLLTAFHFHEVRHLKWMEWNKMVIQSSQQTRILNIVLIVAMLWFLGRKSFFFFFFYSLTVLVVVKNSNRNSNCLCNLHFLRVFFPWVQRNAPLLGKKTSQTSFGFGSGPCWFFQNGPQALDLHWA